MSLTPFFKGSGVSTKIVRTVTGIQISDINSDTVVQGDTFSWLFSILILLHS